MHALFVYGTLRRPIGGPAGDTHYHHRIVDDIHAAWMATLAAAQLYDFGAYPGVGAGRGQVRGELFEISDAALAAADEIEGHPEFYERRIESVQLDDGSSIDAWVYWAPPVLLDDSRLIGSGDWFDRDRHVARESVDEVLAAAKSQLASVKDERLSP